MNSAGKWCAILLLATRCAQTSYATENQEARDFDRGGDAGIEGRNRRTAGSAGRAAAGNSATARRIASTRIKPWTRPRRGQRCGQQSGCCAGAASQQQEAVIGLKADVSDLRTNALSTTVTLQEVQKNVKAEIESPVALHYKGITITPGGFAAAESVRRSRALGSDINTPFNSLTLPGASQNAMSGSLDPDVSREFRHWPKGDWRAPSYQAMWRRTSCRRL